MKICSKCDVEKPLGEFYRRREGGPSSACKSCIKAQASESYYANRKVEPKYCDICSALIEGKRPRRSKKDKLFRCATCQKERNRDLLTKQMRNALKGPKAEHYKATRNRAKAAWEKRNPTAAQARSLIKSVKRRLRDYNFDFERFIQPETRALAKALLDLPDYCVGCYAKEDLTVEHIKPLIDFPELGLEPTNLTTLCRSCNTRSYHGN